MSAPNPRPARYEDLRDLPEHLVGEVVEGELRVHPRPAPRHAHASSILGRRVGTPYDDGIGGPGGWWIPDEPEIHFSEARILVPDLAGWRRARMPELPETAWFELAPDWVCENLSPATARTDKMRIYAEQGVPHVWLVDPGLRTLEVYALEGDHWGLIATLKDDDPVRQPPFEAIEFPLDTLWE